MSRLSPRHRPAVHIEPQLPDSHPSHPHLGRRAFLPPPDPPSRTIASSPSRHLTSNTRPVRRDFAADAAEAAQTQPDYQATLRDVEHALHSADIALRNAREAFRNSGMANRSNVIDLTVFSSEGSADDHFMTQTRHPQDASRGRATIRAADSFNEPTLGAEPARGYPHDQPSQQGPAYPHTFMDILEPNFNYQPIYHPPGYRLHEEQHVRRAEESAVRRQAQARRDWARVERRNRQRAQAQAERDAAERAERAARTDSRQRDRSDSNASQISSFSAASAYSLDSESTNAGQTINMAAVDLTAADDAKTLDGILAKEQQEAIANQNKADPMKMASDGSKSASAFSSYKCAICMDSPTHATTTICGHLFCHQCIIDSLKWSEQLRRGDDGPGSRKNGLCPVCRKPLQSKEATTVGKGVSGGVVSLEIKKVPRKQFEADKQRQVFLDNFDAKGKQRAKTEDSVSPTAIDLEPNCQVDDHDPASLGKAFKRKRKRTEVTRSTAETDSLFGSDA